MAAPAALDVLADLLQGLEFDHVGLEHRIRKRLRAETLSVKELLIEEEVRQSQIPQVPV